MTRFKQPPMIHPGAWSARKPKTPPIPVGRPERIIFHHTAGHHAEISNPGDESRAEAMRYARDIQRFHMAPGGLGAANGGNDSGHNFLVCRNGLILVGRWESWAQIRRGHMVLSAHCPGQNDQPGIEHEHNGTEPMTPAQFEASAHLCAWIMDRCGMQPGAIFPHRQFFATACPGVLDQELPRLRARVAALLKAAR